MDERLARDIEVLAELFKSGGWAELRVESEGISLLLSNDPAASLVGETKAVAPGQPQVAEPKQKQVSAAKESAAASPAPPVADVAIDPKWVAIVAPNLGTFYRAPKPGAPPFVEVGQAVTADTEVCLIEVMKLFTSVRAGVAGIVRHIAVADAELVDADRPLIYIERD